jgi:hypothetical protein
MNKKTVILALAIFLMMGIYIGISYEKPKAPVVSNNTCTAPIYPASSIEVRSDYLSDQMFNIDIEYPYFPGLDASFNKEISDYVSKYKSEFEQSTKSNWQARKDTDPTTPDNPETKFYFKMTWTPVQVNDRYISFIIETYSFSGGAHGDEVVRSFNYDVKNNKVITFEDFIGNNEYNLQKVAEMASKDVKSMLDKDVIFPEGTDPNFTNFSTFVFNKDNLIIYYQKYQVAPGSEGIIKSIFNKNILDQNGLKIKYFN